MTGILWQYALPSPRSGKVSPKATDEVAQFYSHVRIHMGGEQKKTPKSMSFLFYIFLGGIDRSNQNSAN